MIIIKNKKLILTLSTLLIAFLFTGCFLFNSSPIIESDPVTTAKEGALYTYEVEATDPEGDELTFTLLSHPDGMMINSSTGVISWTPTESQIGDNEVVVEVSDGSRSDTQSFTITVEENSFTSIEVLPASMSIKAGSSQKITSVTAYYDDGTEPTNIALTACTYESNNSKVTVTNGVVKVASTCSGTVATIIVNYTEDGVTKSDTVTVIVSVVPSSGG